MVRVDLKQTIYRSSISVRQVHARAARAKRILARAGFSFEPLPNFARTGLRVKVRADNCDAAHWEIFKALKRGGMRMAAKFFTTTNCVQR